MTGPATTLTDRYAAAVDYAAKAHASQLRKGTRIPYVAHLLGVSSLVLDAGGTEDQAIAGLLHDAVEDAGGLSRLADIRARFGDEVADIVLACSDSTDKEWKARTPYWERKRAYLDRLADERVDAVLVSIADKVHNSRSIATDLERDGLATLKRFKGTPEQILEYYRTCLSIAEARGITADLVIPLRSATATIAAFVEENGE